MAAESPTLKLPRILLADDSTTSSVIVSRYLKNHYDVRCAADGVAAWEALTTDPSIELVVTDVEMPRLGGHELLAKIRASTDVRMKHMPVIVMTTIDNDADRQMAFAHGASDFVGKPPDPLELQARVRLHQQLAATIRELEAKRELLREQVSTDPLTRLKSRHAFREAGGRHFALAKRHRRDLAVVMFDLDHFKHVNDTHGHSADDRLLVSVAQILARDTRAGDTTARLGDKRFAVLLPNTNRAGATRLAERIRAAMVDSGYTVGGRAVTMTASTGVASCGDDAPASLDQLIESADRRLDRDKRAGRNGVVA